MPSVVNEFGAMPAAPDAFDLRLVDLGGGEAMVEVRTTGGAHAALVDLACKACPRPEPRRLHLDGTRRVQIESTEPAL